MTANLVFTVTLSIYRLVINLFNAGGFRLKLPQACTENISINTIDKNFASNLLFQGSIEQNYLSDNKKISGFAVFNKNINFNTEFQYKVSLKNDNL